MQPHVSRAPAPESKDTRISCAGIYVRTCEYSRVIHCNTRVYAREVCTCEYPYEQVVLRVPAEVNASKVTRISCAGITTRDFLSSSNQAVP